MNYPVDESILTSEPVPMSVARVSDKGDQNNSINTNVLLMRSERVGSATRNIANRSDGGQAQHQRRSKANG